MPSLTNVFRGESARTRKRLTLTARQAQREAWTEAADAFGSLEAGLRSWLRRFGEQILPLVDIKAGAASALTRTLAEAHRSIESALEGVGQGVRARRPDEVRRRGRELRAALDQHDAQVERLVLPLLDGLLTDVERRRLLDGPRPAA